MIDARAFSLFTYVPAIYSLPDALELIVEADDHEAMRSMLAPFGLEELAVVAVGRRKVELLGEPFDADVFGTCVTLRRTGNDFGEYLDDADGAGVLRVEAALAGSALAAARRGALATDLPRLSLTTGFDAVAKRPARSRSSGPRRYLLRVEGDGRLRVLAPRSVIHWVEAPADWDAEAGALFLGNIDEARLRDGSFGAMAKDLMAPAGLAELRRDVEERLNRLELAGLSLQRSAADVVEEVLATFGSGTAQTVLRAHALAKVPHAFLDRPGALMDEISALIALFRHSGARCGVPAGRLTDAAARRIRDGESARRVWDEVATEILDALGRALAASPEDVHVMHRSCDDRAIVLVTRDAIVEALEQTGLVAPALDARR